MWLLSKPTASPAGYSWKQGWRLWWDRPVGVLWLTHAGFSLFLVVSSLCASPPTHHFVPSFLPNSLPCILKLSTRYKINSQKGCPYHFLQFLKVKSYNQSLILHYFQCCASLGKRCLVEEIILPHSTWKTKTKTTKLLISRITKSYISR